MRPLRRRGGLIMLNVKHKIAASAALAVFALDQWTKWLVVQALPYGEVRMVFPGWLDLVHYRNRGAAFGFLSDWDSGFRDIFFYALSILAFAFLFQVLRQIPAEKKHWSATVGLVIGGALGNIADRIFRGSVVDFVSVHLNNGRADFELFGRAFMIPLTWPAFNVADAAITVGVILLVFVLSALNPRAPNTKH